MKHQLSLRRLLCYVALIAVGMGMLRAAFYLLIGPAPVVGSGMVVFAFFCIAASVCCPIGFLIKGKDGEVDGANSADNWLCDVIGS